MCAAEPRPPQAILRVQQLPAAVDFYVAGLGLDLVHSDPAGGVACVEGRVGARLVLALPGADASAWPRTGESAPGARVYLNQADLPRQAAVLAARGLTPLHGPTETHPGYRELVLTDPDGYQVTLWESWDLPPDQVLALYGAGPQQLAAALAGLGPRDLDRPLAPGRWTIRQVVHHIVDADLGTFPLLHLALLDSGRTIQPNTWDPDTANRGLCHHRRPVEPGLALLTAGRAWVLDTVSHLPGALDRYVVWPSGHRAVVGQVLQRVGGHALHHIGQIWAARRPPGGQPLAPKPSLDV